MRKTHLITNSTVPGNTVCGTKMRGRIPIWVTRYPYYITCKKCEKIHESDEEKKPLEMYIETGIQLQAKKVYSLENHNIAFELLQKKIEQKFMQYRAKTDLLFKKYEEKVAKLYSKHCEEKEQAWLDFKKKYHYHD